MIPTEIQEKFKAYKKEICEQLGVNENSIRLCDLARQNPLDENGEIKDEFKAKIRERIENSKKQPKREAIKPKKEHTVQARERVETDIVDYSKMPFKKIKVIAEFEIEVPKNVEAKNVEKLSSNLAKEHFKNCKDVICQDVVS